MIMLSHKKRKADIIEQMQRTGNLNQFLELLLCSAGTSRPNTGYIIKKHATRYVNCGRGVN